MDAENALNVDGFTSECDAEFGHCSTNNQNLAESEIIFFFFECFICKRARRYGSKKGRKFPLNE